MAVLVFIMLFLTYKKTSCHNLPTSQLSLFLFRVEAIIYQQIQLFIAFFEKNVPKK